MKCQILFSGKNIINLSSAEFAQRQVKVNTDIPSDITLGIFLSWNNVGQHLTAMVTLSGLGRYKAGLKNGTI